MKLDKINQVKHFYTFKRQNPLEKKYFRIEIVIMTFA